MADAGTVLDESRLFDFHFNVGRNGNHDGGILHFGHFAVEAADGDHLVAFLEAVAELLFFLGFLRLRTD